MAEGKLDSTLGAVEVGTMISAILYGMVLVQGHMYSVASRSDRLWVKVLVLLVVLLETLHMVAMISYVYYASVTHVGEASALIAIKWFTVINITLSSLVGTPVQAYFTWRAWVVSQKAWYATPPWAAELVRMTIVLANCVFLTESDTVSQYKITQANLITSTLSMCLFVDLWNSAVLVYHLKSQRTAFERTLTYINSIIIWSIETSLLICVLAAVSLGFWLIAPENSIWLSLLMVHAKIYSNSMLLSLNARILRKAASARPRSLQRTWELAHIRSPGGPLSSSTVPDSAAIATPGSLDSSQYAYVSYDSKFAVDRPQHIFTPSLTAAGYNVGHLPKLSEDV